MKRTTLHICLILTITLVCLASCRDDELVMPFEYEILPDDATIKDDLLGIYLLNEGNMGANKASLDFVDFKNNLYIRNWYPFKNPTVVKELGDVGNDIQIYGNRLYAVINCSNKVEVMDAESGIRIGQINIPNCRYINFSRGHAYVTSYVGPVGIDPLARLGAVFKVDTASLKIVGEVTVGYQPDELEIIGEYIYVANSGGYRGAAEGGQYDNTVSVVEMYGMKQIQKITVGLNLHRIKKDKYNRLWVSSRGDYKKTPSNLFLLERKDKNSREMVVTDTLNVACSNMAISGDSLYFYSTEWNKQTETNDISYGIINLQTKELVTKHFITDGTENQITIPYGISVNPQNGDIYVTDAKNYLVSGFLHCYSREGIKKWSVRTGDIPAHMAFLYNKQAK